MSVKAPGAMPKNTIHKILSKNAQEVPNKAAYTYLPDQDGDPEIISYEDLHNAAINLAHSLLENAVPGDRALLLYPPGLDYIVAFYACLYAGIIAVPLYPPSSLRKTDRLVAVMQDVDARIALTTPQLCERLRAFSHEQVAVDNLCWLPTQWRELLQAKSDEEGLPDIAADHLAFLQYTSGSTGKPKGVMLSHANLLHNSALIARDFQTGADSVTVSWLPPYHDMGLIGGILQPMFQAYPCVLMSPASFLRQPLRWLQAISDYRGTHCGGPNFAYDLCVERIDAEDLTALDLSSWKVAFNGAEPIRAETLLRFEQTFADCGLPAGAAYPCYGLAEATLMVSGGTPLEPLVSRSLNSEALAAGRVQADDEQAVSLVGSGRPGLDMSIAVVDPKTGERCADDQIGEIWISGPSIAEGYWQKDEETRQTFAARLPGDERNYMRSGDLGCLIDGELFITGRHKDLIIIRGRNLYPQDIEWVAEQAHPALRTHSCAAFSLPEDGEERLVIVQELDYRQKPDTAEVLTAIRSRIAEQFEVQAAAVLLIRPGSLPKTSSGKVQRYLCKQRLTQGELQVVDQYYAGRADAVPSTASERMSWEQVGQAPSQALRAQYFAEYVRAEIAEVLNLSIDQVEPQQSLAALGLDSLSAVNLAARLNKVMGGDIEFSSLLHDQTLQDWLTTLTEQLQTGHILQASAFAERGEGRRYPLSQGQRSLWFFNRLSPESTAYSVVFAAKVSGTMDVAAFQRALQSLVQRQPSLRTTFGVEEGEPYQQVHAYMPANIERVDGGNWSQARIDAYLSDVAHRPFNLAEGPLMRVTLVEKDAGEAYLQVVMHHIIVDFWSFVVLVHELSAFYQQENQGVAHGLPSLPAEYIDHVIRQQQALDSAQMPQHRDYWLEQLRDAPLASELPLDRARPSLQSFRGASLPMVLDEALTVQLKALAREQGVTLYVLLLTAFEVLMARLCKRSDFVIGTPTAGRYQQDFADLVGYFVNAIPLRCRVDGEQSFTGLLKQTRAQVLEGLSHAAYPFASMVSDLLDDRDASRHPIFQVMFVLQKAHRLDEAGLTPFVLGERGASLSIGGLQLESHPIEQRISPFDLLLMMAEADGRLLASFQYNTDLFESDSIERFADYYRQLLQQIVEQPQSSVGELQLLSEAQRRQIVVDWNNTRVAQPAPAVLQSLFDAQVEATPDAVAIEEHDDRLSYRALQQRAEQLAGALYAEGIRPGDVVGLLADRSIDLLVATLAVLKAGGTYLPLEAHYPTERLQGMLSDSRCRLLLASVQYTQKANALQWAVDSLDALLIIDAPYAHAFIEQGEEESDRNLWDYVAEQAQDDIDASGWMNSYTGEYFSAEEMEEYANNIVMKLVPHLTPDKRVLEVGCGSGLSMFQLAPWVGQYHGTDLSPVIIEKNRRHAAEQGMDNISLEALPADRIGEAQGEDYDVVIINSVIQLFPGHNYLRSVLSACIERLNGRGLIFLGDVMDLARRQSLLDSLQAFEAEHAGQGYKTKTDWDRELFLSETFFQDLKADLPGVVAVTVSDKIGELENELTRFRYDVLLRIDVRAWQAGRVDKHKRQQGRAYIEQCPPLASLPVHPQQAAYIMYTSGSTGRPKGIAVPHRAVVRLVKDNAYADFDRDERIAHISNPAFDAATYEIWGALLNGGRLLVFERDEVLDLQRFTRLLKQRRVSAMFLTAALFSLIGKEEPAAFSGMKHLLVGGDAMDAAAAQAVLAKAPPQRLSNDYGPTEGTTFSCWYDLQAGEDLPGGVPIGRPLSNSQAYVLDEQMQPVPIGVPGELYIGGLGLANGYQNRPGLTAERFVPDPFHREPGQRLYRSGDLVRYRSDGNIVFLGRIDHQVKIRGFRIEPAEIEQVLLTYPRLQEAAVLAVDGERGGKELLAYVVAKNGEKIKDADLRGHLAKRLPEYMLPSAYLHLDKLPLNNNGKLDRKALPSIERLQRADGDALQSPQTGTEKRLAAIWSEVLGGSYIGRQDNFFDLGGHSLLASQVVSRVRSALDLEMPLRYLFEYPTLKAQAQAIDRLCLQGMATGQAGIVAAPQGSEPQLSYAQQRLWFLDQLQPGNPFYNVPGGLVLNGVLDVEALQQALNEIVVRHDILRSRYRSVAGQAQVSIAEPQPVNLATVDLQLLDKRTAQQVLERAANAEAQRPFALQDGGLIRATLLHMNDRHHVLLLTMHHIVSDGWSIGVLLRELASLYPAYKAGQPASLAALPLQYSDFAHWQRQWLSGEVHDRQLAYWREHLNGAPDGLELPLDKARPAIQTYNGSQEPLALDAVLVERLNRLAQSQGCTLFMVLLAGFQALLHRLSGQDDICIGTPIANRNRQEIEGLIGFFVNTLVLRARPQAQMSFRDLLLEVREATLGGYAHQDLPFEHLVEDIRPQRDLRRSPLFQVMFVLQNTPDVQLQLPQLEVSRFDLQNHTAKFELTLAFSETPQGLKGYLEYNSDLFERDSIVEWGQYYTRLLEAVVADVDQALIGLPLSTGSERAALLGQSRGAQIERAEACLQSLIEAQVERRPEAPALHFDGRTLSYAELNRRANAWAHRLRAQGIGPDRLVAVCLPRGTDLLIALLAVLKAGGAYVPIDPEHPEARQALMLEDSGAELLLTHRDLSVRFAERTQCLCLDEADDQLQPQTNPQPLGSADNLAYVIYTSGSTGKPKGAMLAHRGVVNRLQWMQEAYALDENDRYLLKTPYSFDVSVWELFLPLISGACLIIARPGGHRDPLYLQTLIAEQNISIVHFVPSMLGAFLADDLKQTLPSLRYIVCSGEALPAALLARCAGQLPDVHLENLYGPTEASVDVSFHRCDAGQDLHSVPIGRPISNTQLYVLDQNLNPQPDGIAGELYIGGVGLARGYLQRPQTTAESFVPDPFSEVPGARLYKTGDLVRRRRDGVLEFLGRLDHQVKIRGFRIELGEIEAALLAHRAVREAVVIADTARQNLKAYVACDAPVSTEQLLDALRRELPDYMLPAQIAFLEHLPLNANGKLDRRALESVEPQAPRSREYVAPRTDTETAVAAIWQELLSVEPVGVHDSFFDLGGHSLLATRVVSRVRDRLQVELALTELFKHTTVASLAAYIDSRPVMQPTPAITQISRKNRRIRVSRGD